jgi:hypothetical protein
MIIWRGMGILALIIAVIVSLIVHETANSMLGIPEGIKHYRDAYKVRWIVSMGLSALACWFFGNWLESRELKNTKVAIDKESGQEIRLISRHDMFWIPIRWWSIIWLVAGLWLSLS